MARLGQEMTTIIYRNGLIAGDTAIFDRGVYCGQMQKIGRAPDGTIGGGCGAVADVSQFLAWLEGGMKSEPCKIQDTNSECIFIRPDGEIWWLGHESLPTKIEAQYLAIGSGFPIAMGALAFGADAAQAMEICADLDNRTRRPIDSLALGEVMR